MQALGDRRGHLLDELQTELETGMRKIAKVSPNSDEVSFDGKEHAAELTFKISWPHLSAIMTMARCRKRMEGSLRGIAHTDPFEASVRELFYLEEQNKTCTYIDPEISIREGTHLRFGRPSGTHRSDTCL